MTKHIHIHVGGKTRDAGDINMASLQTRISSYIVQADKFQKQKDYPNRNRALDAISDLIERSIG
jgi:hypothetical protein